MKIVESAGELIGDPGSQDLAIVSSVLLVERDKLGRSVTSDQCLNILDIGLVEGRRRAVLEEHVGNVLLVVEGETGQDFLRTRGDSSLVGTRVLVQLDPLGLESLTGLLGDEQVGSLDNVLEVALALGVEKLVDVGQVDSLGSTSTRHEHVGLETEVGGVPKGQAIGNDLAGCNREENTLFSADQNRLPRTIGTHKAKRIPCPRAG